jgi:hypothetical protein
MNPTTETTTRTRRRLNAIAPPAPLGGDATAARQRLRAALGLIGQERGPGGDYHPADATVLDAWNTTCALMDEDRASAIAHLDGFVCAHQGDLRDLALRARHGHGPMRLLRRVADAIDEYLRGTGDR